MLPRTYSSCASSSTTFGSPTRVPNVRGFLESVGMISPVCKAVDRGRGEIASKQSAREPSAKIERVGLPPRRNTSGLARKVYCGPPRFPTKITNVCRRGKRTGNVFLWSSKSVLWQTETYEIQFECGELTLVGHIKCFTCTCRVSHSGDVEATAVHES